jgi:hypothetical protein
MKIYKRYLDELKVNKTTLEFAVDKLEGSGFWKKGTVKPMLKSGQVVQSPYCMFANNKEVLLQ